MNTSEEHAIAQLIYACREVLNASNVQGILDLYTDDGVFMAPEQPSAVGKVQLKASLERTFSQISLQREFRFDEIVQQGNFAFVRSTSTGTTTILRKGATIPEVSRELFVLQKVNGHWKIARYIFNRMSPQEHS